MLRRNLSENIAATIAKQKYYIETNRAFTLQQQSIINDCEKRKITKIIKPKRKRTNNHNLRIDRPKIQKTISTLLQQQYTIKPTATTATTTAESTRKTKKINSFKNLLKMYQIEKKTTQQDNQY